MGTQHATIQLPIWALEAPWSDAVLGRTLRLVAHMRQKADAEGSCELALHEVFAVTRLARTDLALEALRELPEVTGFEGMEVEVDRDARTASVYWPSHADWK